MMTWVAWMPILAEFEVRVRSISGQAKTPGPGQPG